MKDPCEGCKLWPQGLCHNVCNMAMAQIRENNRDALPDDSEGLLTIAFGGRRRMHLQCKEYEYAHYATRFTYGEAPKIPGEKPTYTEGQL